MLPASLRLVDNYTRYSCVQVDLAMAAVRSSCLFLIAVYKFCRLLAHR